jgi:hypothetical protein
VFASRIFVLLLKVSKEGSEFTGKNGGLFCMWNGFSVRRPLNKKRDFLTVIIATCAEWSR